MIGIQDVVELVERAALLISPSIDQRTKEEESLRGAAIRAEVEHSLASSSFIDIIYKYIFQDVVRERERGERTTTTTSFVLEPDGFM